MANDEYICHLINHLKMRMTGILVIMNERLPYKKTFPFFSQLLAQDSILYLM